MNQLRSLKKGKINPRFNNPKSIEEENKTETKECLEKIQEILNQFDCVMLPEFLISGSELQSRVKIIKKPGGRIIKP
jgi:hypothetical protein